MKVQTAMHKGVELVRPDTPITELAKLIVVSMMWVPFRLERMTSSSAW